MPVLPAPVVDVGALPARRGGPAPTDGPRPHQQTDQIAPKQLQEALFERAARLPGVTVGDTLVSVEGARAFHLAEDQAKGPDQAFQAAREFAHLHPAYDGSLHMTLPPQVKQAAVAAGWAEPHPYSGTPLVFGPRDADELEVVWALLVASWRYASGE